MKDCVLFAPMIGARPGELTAGEAKALEAHLSACGPCRGVARNAALTDGLVGEALLARASARDFAPFVDEVMARIERAGQPGLGVWWAWLRRHRRAAAAALVPALAGLAVIVYVRLGSGRSEIAMLELSSEGEATTVLQTSDGPVVLLSEENGS
ncbi:MAG TPA: zf-HC2 domain-containing protein [Anaeromyxobacter sp.]